jgi:hypothetical protein
MDTRAIIFVPALAGAVIFGFVFCLFAAHAYLTVLQTTGAGAKQVTWVNDPILDHFWKMFYLAWLIGLWLGPAYFLGRAFAGSSAPVWLKLGIPLAVFWLCYPVSQLSSLSGPTIWLPFWPDVLGRLARKPGVVLGFLGLSAVVLGGLGLGFHWAFFKEGIVWLFVGCPVFVTCGLLYARLLGRLAFVLAFTRSIFTRKRKKEPAPDQEAAAVVAEPKEEPQHELDPGFTQPSELPPIHTPDEGALTGYDLRDDRPAKPRKRVVAEVVEEPKAAPPRAVGRPSRKNGQDPSREWTEEDEDATPYGVTEAEAVPEEAAAVNVIKPSEVEMRLLSRDDAPKRPKRAWTGEVLAFLGQPETWTAIVMLSGMCVLVGGMIRIARAFNPADGP